MSINDITSFFEVLVGNMNGKKLPFLFYVIPLIFILVFFVIKDFLLIKKDELAKNKKKKISEFFINVLAAWGICSCCLFMVENMLISIIFGILAAIFISSKISETSKNKKEENTENSKKETEEKVEKIEHSNVISNNSDSNITITTDSNKGNTNNTNTVNVTINNNKEDEEDILPDFYNPHNLRLPDNITSFNQLNIIMILEMYGYIAPNHKFKMITQSIFETPEEQVEKLLQMFVLDESELKEARAILNLIKLNNRLVSKEEALHCIMEIEKKNKQKEKEE